MSRIVILEGARGTGKSTVARAIREKIPEMTLVNPTGFHLNGKEGLDKIYKYYDSWISFLWFMKDHDSTIVFDRFFFTEMVFSSLYKDYDFTEAYNLFLISLFALPIDIDIVFLKIDDEEELKDRLTRDKVPFGNAKESIAETIKQQGVYDDIMSDIDWEYTHIKVHYVDTTHKTKEKIQEEVFEIIKGEEI
jgi:thymidylate kinase